MLCEDLNQTENYCFFLTKMVFFFDKTEFDVRASIVFFLHYLTFMAQVDYVGVAEMLIEIEIIRFCHFV